MPQNAIIRANGTGDYTTIIAWEAGEQNANYGSITIGRVDGFFDMGTNLLQYQGTWTHGSRLEPFDSADGFDGTERQLCGLIGNAGTRGILFQTNTPIEWDSLEVFRTSGSNATTIQDVGSGTRVIANCLFDNSLGAIINNAKGLDNCVLVGNSFTSDCEIDNSTIISSLGSDIGNSQLTASNSVSVNIGAGGDWAAAVIQSNNASTDATADFLDNIVIADNFENSDPHTSKDYRIKAGSDLDTNGIGAFIQSASGITVTGTAVPTQTEADIVTGGKTIILTLAGDTFVTGTSSEDGIAGGSDSDITASGTNWDSLIKTALDNNDVVLSVGDTVATITLPAFGTYDIPGTETITWTIPAARLTTGTSDIIATPTHTITAVVSGVSIPVIMNSYRQRRA